MGIKGLLPRLKRIVQKVSISRYSHETVAIDGHTVLYKGAKEYALKQRKDICASRCTTLRRPMHVLHSCQCDDDVYLSLSASIVFQHHVDNDSISGREITAVSPSFSPAVCSG